MYVKQNLSLNKNFTEYHDFLSMLIDLAKRNRYLWGDFDWILSRIVKKWNNWCTEVENCFEGG